MSSDDRDSKRREMISQGLKKKKERESRASEIVENLIYNVTNRDTIRNSLKFITQVHYEDIVSERAIDGECGYVVCINSLEKFSQRPQTYHICTKTNTVLELAERKKFCSELCYTHSSYLQGQILTSPLWLREESDKKISYVFADENDIKQATASVSSATKSKSDEEKKPADEIIVDIPNKKEKPRRRHYLESKQENSSEVVFDAFKQWWTKDSSAYLNGNKLETFKGNKECDKSQGSQTLPQPDSLMLESPGMKKMQAFYNGTTDVDTTSLLGAVKELNLDEKVQTILPRIDKTAQKSIRREIVLESFQKAFDKFSDFVDFSWNDVCKPTKDLVSTFNLTADNIVLHPSGWMVATGILIHFLATKSDSPLKNGLEQPFMKQLSSKMTYGGKHVSIFVDELMNLA